MKDKWYEESSDFNKCIHNVNIIVTGRFEDDGSHSLNGKFISTERYMPLDDVRKLFYGYQALKGQFEQMESLLQKVAGYSNSLSSMRKIKK